MSINLFDHRVIPKDQSISWLDADMSFRMSSSGTYNSPVRKEDYERMSRTERLGRNRKGKRRMIFGGGKRAQERTVMPIFAQTAAANETPLILDPETESKYQLQSGISADGIPIKKFLPNKTFHIRPYSRSKRKVQMATLSIANNTDPAVDSVSRRKLIKKSPSVPYAINAASQDTWTKLAHAASVQDLLGPHTNPDKLLHKQKLQPVPKTTGNLRELFNPRAQIPMDDESLTDQTIQQIGMIEDDLNKSKTLGEIYDEAHIHAKGAAEYPFEPDVDEGRLLNIFLQRRRRQSCPLLPIVPAAPGKDEMPTVSQDSFFLVKTLNNRVPRRHKLTDAKTRKAVEAINLISRNEQRLGTSNVATYCSRRIFGIQEYKRLLSPIQQLEKKKVENLPITFVKSNKIALQASASGSDILNIDGEDVVVPAHAPKATLSAPRSEMSMSVSITTRKGSESITHEEAEATAENIDLQYNNLKENLHFQSRIIYVYISTVDKNYNEKEIDALFYVIFPALNRRLRHMNVRLHPTMLAFKIQLSVEQDSVLDESVGLKFALEEIKECSVLISLGGPTDTTGLKNTKENFVSEDPHMTYFVRDTLSSSQCTNVGMELRYAMDLGKKIFVYRRDDIGQNSIAALDSTLMSYSRCKYSSYSDTDSHKDDFGDFESKVIEDLYNAIMLSLDAPKLDPLSIELEHQNRFVREKNMNSAQFNQKPAFIGKLEAMNASKPIVILGEKESGRSSCATSIYNHYKEGKDNYATLFYSAQASGTSRHVEQMLRFFILQILSQDRTTNPKTILGAGLPTLKLFFVMAIERYAKRLMSIGKSLLLVLDGLEYLTDPEGKSLTTVDWLPQRMPTNIDFLVTSDTDSAVTNGFFSCFSDNVYTLLSHEVWLSSNGNGMAQNILKVHDVKWKHSDLSLLRKTVDVSSPSETISYIRLVDWLAKMQGEKKRRKDIISKMPRRSIELGFEIIAQITLSLEQYLNVRNIQNVMIQMINKSHKEFDESNQSVSSFMIEHVLGAMYVSRSGLEIDEILRVLFPYRDMTISEVLRGKQVIRRVMKDLSYFIPNWNDSDFGRFSLLYRIKSKFLNETISKLYASPFQSLAKYYRSLSAAMHILEYENSPVVTIRYLMDLPHYMLMSYDIRGLSRYVCSLDFVNACMIENEYVKIGVRFKQRALNLYRSMISTMLKPSYLSKAIVVAGSTYKREYAAKSIKKSVQKELSKACRSIMAYYNYFHSWIFHRGTNNKDHMLLFGLNTFCNSNVYKESSAYVEMLEGSSKDYVYTWKNKPDENANAYSIYSNNSNEITCFQATPRSRLFVVGHENGNVFLCEKESCQTIQSFVFNGHRNAVEYVFMLHYGTFVASVSKNTLILWDSSTSTALEKTNFKKELTVCCCGDAGNVKCPALITCTSSGEIICWYFNENSTDKILKHVEFSSVGESSRITAVTISPCSKFVVVGLANGYIQFWDVLESGLRSARTYQLPDKSVPQALSFDNISSLLLIGDGIIGNIYMYSIDGNLCSKFVGHSAPISSLSWDKDGAHFLSSSHDGKTIFWNTKHPEQNTLVAQSHEYIVSSQFNDCDYCHDSEDSTIYPKGSKSLLIVDKNAVYFITKDVSQINKGKRKEWIYYHRQAQDEKMNNVVPTMDQLCFRMHQNEVTCASFSLETSRVLTGCAGGIISCLCYDTNKTLHVMSCGVGESVTKVIFSPSDKYILSGNDKGIMHLWDGHTYELLRYFEWHTSGISAAVFSKTNDFFASGSVAGMIQTWNPVSGQLVRYGDEGGSGKTDDSIHDMKKPSLSSMHKHSVELLVLTNDESHILSCSNIGEIRVFVARTLELIYVNTDIHKSDGYKSIFVRYKSSIPFLIGTTKTIVQSVDITDLMEMSNVTKCTLKEDLKLQEDISTLRNEMLFKFKGLTDDVSIAEKKTLLEHLNGNTEKLHFKLANAIEDGKLTSFASGSVLDLCSKFSNCLFNPTKTTVAIEPVYENAIFPIFECYSDVKCLRFHPLDKSIVVVGDSLGNVYILHSSVSAYEALDEPGME